LDQPAARPCITTVAVGEFNPATEIVLRTRLINAASAIYTLTRTFLPQSPPILI